MSSNIYDVIIIGAGPAGLTAGIYAARRSLKTLILSQDLGGQTALTYEIENYPGYDLIDGLSLMQKFAKQAQKFGAQIKYSEVESITKKDNVFLIKTNQQKYQSKALILAFGLHRRHLDVTGEKKYKGRGVSYCTICDGPLYKNKVVAVVGGGNSALEAAEYLSSISKKVYLIHRRHQFRGDEALVTRLERNSKVELVLDSEVVEITGGQTVESITVKNSRTQMQTKKKVSGLFIEIGFTPKTDLVAGLVKLNKQNEIISNKDTETSRAGVFACGDVTDICYKQIVISAGEGAKAALQVYKYLKLQEGEKVLPDWERKK